MQSLSKPNTVGLSTEYQLEVFVSLDEFYVYFFM